MASKHYREAAAAVMAAHGDMDTLYENGRRSAAREIATELADMFERDNPAFDRQKFMEACGLR